MQRFLMVNWTYNEKWMLSHVLTKEARHIAWYSISSYWRYDVTHSVTA